MNILAPVNSLEHIPDLFEHGAKELYVGFHDPNWTCAFGAHANLNRMSSFGHDANPYTLDQLEPIIETAHRHGTAVFITLNAESYSKAMLEIIRGYLAELRAMRADGIIVSEIAAARIVLEAGMNAVASTMCGIYNRDLAAFYIREGIKRIILPRDLSLSEIESIVSFAPEAEYEVFMMRSGCKFSDSFCLGFHYAKHGALCQNLRRSRVSVLGEKLSFHDRQRALLNEMTYQSLFSLSEACGLCALYRLSKLGIAACKIVGRAEAPGKILRDIDIVRTNLQVVKRVASEAEYLRDMIFPEDRDRICFMGKSCYYPEIRFSGEGGIYE